MPAKQYPHQDLSLRNIKGEKWKDFRGLESYFMVSNFGRIKRLEYDMQYKNGANYTKPEKIIKPTIIRAKNTLKNDVTFFLVNRIVLDGIRYNLTISRIVYYHFVSPFKLDDSRTVIFCKDGDGLHIHPRNLVKATLSDKSKRIFARGRMESPFKHLSEKNKRKQRKAIADRLSKMVTQYSLKGRKLKSYPSAAAAERATGVHATSIGQRAGGKGISAGGYVWRWGNEKTTDIENVRNRRKAASRIKNGQKVTQYDFDGKKVAQFYSLQDAQAASGAHTNAIRLVLKGVYKSAKGYFWKAGFGKNTINLSTYKWGKESMAAAQSKKVRQLTLQGKLIKLYPSVKTAALSIGVTPSVITDVCKGRQKTSHGFRWEYRL